MGENRPDRRRKAVLITAAVILAAAAYTAGILTGAAAWRRPIRYEYRTGPGGLMYRADTHTGRVHMHNLRTATWLLIEDPPTWEETEPLPPGFTTENK